ncbi:AAA family ATPase [Paenibacillus sp. Leaf72]|uniref:AAA family ATPase n=1 Tax=Paenibacillus sp. Leaf72 TaxID=1736234 RepID=UPI0007005381|nr:AAA family ATPase [Paenibacillus sp. Leaf72]KQN97017.1 hypothetical protein ASF12_23395 [Paenibacillus sp. Leaf72]
MTTDQHALRQVQFIQSYLQSKYYERNEIIYCSLLSMIASEHMLLIGPPGAAKSSVLDDICGYMREVVYFKWTMNNETSTDELLGPYDKARKDYGLLKRITANKLPEAHIALLDETLRATGETLNSLLTILNERSYMQEGKSLTAPLISLFGATNDYPDDDNIQALYDRFLIRIRIDYIKETANLKSLLKGGSSSIEDMGSLSISDLKKLKASTKMVEISESIIDSMVEIREELFEHNIFPSDRRLKNSLNLLRAAAVLHDRNNVLMSDLSILKYVLWIKEEDQSIVNSIIDKHLEK